MAEPINYTSVQNDMLEEAILAKVLSKKFRKLRADQAAIDMAKKAIRLAVAANKPIRLTLHFGGNKLWRLEEAPNIDWGELFSLVYFVNWAKSVASVYKPGVIFEYFSMDVCVERMNNIPHEETDQYSDDIRRLFEWVQPYLPKGVTLQYTRYGDLYKNREEYYKELDEAKQTWLANHDGKLPILSDEQRTATEMNVKLQPGQDQDPEWREKVELEHQSIFETKTGGAYMVDPSSIVNCSTWYSGYIATGSTKRSLAKFWVSVGALQRTGDSYAEVVLTPKQLASARFDWEAVHINGLEGKNFHRIRVLN